MGSQTVNQNKPSLLYVVFLGYSFKVTGNLTDKMDSVGGILTEGPNPLLLLSWSGCEVASSAPSHSPESPDPRVVVSPYHGLDPLQQPSDLLN